MTITAHCHCGKVELSFPELPEYLGDCNCSICRRYHALWGYYPPDLVTVESADSAADTYCWGAKEVNFQRCAVCSCITHYTTTELCPENITAVNFRMLDSGLYKNVPIKIIDGATL